MLEGGIPPFYYVSSETYLSTNTSRTLARYIQGAHMMHLHRSQALSSVAQLHTLSQVHS